jgi:hypothetical protein
MNIEEKKRESQKQLTELLIHALSIRLLDSWRAEQFHAGENTNVATSARRKNRALLHRPGGMAAAKVNGASLLR